MKKKIIFISIFIINSLLVYSQKSIRVNPIDSYYESLKLHIDFLKEVHDNLDTIYVKREHYLSDYSGLANGVYVMMVDQKFIFQKTKRKKQLPLIIINPIKFEDGTPIIYVVDFLVSRKRKKYTMANIDRSKVQVFYDCDRLGFKVKKIN